VGFRHAQPAFSEQLDAPETIETKTGRGRNASATLLR
jgi:hypothetical protein